MALRWTQNDTAAYKTVTDAGERMRKAWDERQVGDAWKLDQQEVEGPDVGAMTGSLDEQDAPRKKGYKLGNRTQETRFSDDDVTRARANAAADVYARQGKPEQAFGLRSRAKQDELADVQMAGAKIQQKGLERGERQNDLAEQALRLQAQLRAGADPMQVFQQAAKLYGQVPDGKHASLAVGEDGVPRLVLTDTNSNQSQMFPATAETVSKALDEFYAMTSPHAYEARKKHGLDERRTKATEQTAGAAVTNAATTAAYREDQKPLNAAHADYFRALGERARREPLGGHNALQAYELDQRKKFDVEKEGIIAQVDSGAMSPEAGDAALRRAALKYGGGGGFQKPGAPGKTGIQPVQGNPGMFTDGQALYRFDERTQGLVEIQTPQNLRDLATGIGANLRGGSGGPGGLRTPGSPGPARGLGAVLDQQQPRRRGPQAPLTDEDQMMYP